MLWKAGIPQPLTALAPLAVARLFTDQVFPSGGFGGRLLVVLRIALQLALCCNALQQERRMTRDEYEAHRRRLGEELRAAIELAEEGYRARLRALDLAWEQSAPGVPLPSLEPPAKSRSQRRPGELYAERSARRGRGREVRAVPYTRPAASACNAALDACNAAARCPRAAPRGTASQPRAFVLLHQCTALLHQCTALLHHGTASMPRGTASQPRTFAGQAFSAARAPWSTESRAGCLSLPAQSGKSLERGREKPG